MTHQFSGVDPGGVPKLGSREMHPTLLLQVQHVSAEIRPDMVCPEMVGTLTGLVKNEAMVEKPGVTKATRSPGSS